MQVQQQVLQGPRAQLALQNEWREKFWLASRFAARSRCTFHGGESMSGLRNSDSREKPSACGDAYNRVFGAKHTVDRPVRSESLCCRARQDSTRCHGIAFVAPGGVRNKNSALCFRAEQQRHDEIGRAEPRGNQ